MFGFLLGNSGVGAAKHGLSGPGEVPDNVGSWMVTKLKQDPWWVWSLKAVTKADDQRHCYFVRVFDPKSISAGGIKIKDYHSFDDHPNLVLFEGWFNKKNKDIKLEPKQRPS